MTPALARLHFLTAAEIARLHTVEELRSLADALQGELDANERALAELESRVAELAQIKADAAISGTSLVLGIAGIAASPLTFGLGMAFGLASAGFGGWGLWRVSRQLIDRRRDKATADAIGHDVAALRVLAERIEAAIQLAQP